MKRIGLILIANLMMAFPMFSQYVSIRDNTFLYALIHLGVDTNGDSLISFAEAKARNALDFTLLGKGISDLSGIEAFVNLEKLICSFNLLTSLDISKNTALKYLDCGWNHISSLDVSNNVALEELHCPWNDLTSLDVSNNTALTDLNCGSNLLTSLDVSNCFTLQGLYCGTQRWIGQSIFRPNRLTSLDVSDNISLKYLICNYNHLTSLDISNNTALSILDISDCFILKEVCVFWEDPDMPPYLIDIDTTDAPDVTFTTECSE